MGEELKINIKSNDAITSSDSTTQTVRWIHLPYSNVGLSLANEMFTILTSLQLLLIEYLIIVLCAVNQREILEFHRLLKFFYFSFLESLDSFPMETRYRPGFSLASDNTYSLVVRNKDVMAPWCSNKNVIGTTH